MNEAEATNQHDATSVGTPLNYSESVYRFYLELADCSRATRRLIEEFLPQHQTARMRIWIMGSSLRCPSNARLIWPVFSWGDLEKCKGHWRK